jgi:ethanolamine ammonia-lyase large subunit
MFIFNKMLNNIFDPGGDISEIVARFKLSTKECVLAFITCILG